MKKLIISFFMFAILALLFVLCGKYKNKEHIYLSSNVEENGTIQVSEEAVSDKDETDHTAIPDKETVQSKAIYVLPEGKVTETYSVNENVSVERMDHSIHSQDGKMVAEIYYERPVIAGNTDAAKKINAFFEKEAEEWFGGINRLTHYYDGDGESNNWLQYFLNQISDLRDMYGEEVMSEYPSCYKVDTQIACLNNDLLSVFQLVTFNGGQYHNWNYGSTFDLKTGELLSIEQCTDVSVSDMKKAVLNLVETKFREWYDESDFYVHELQELQFLYGDGEISRDEITGDACLDRVRVEYEYFYDGKYIYLTLNHGVFGSDGCIVKWNGQTGDELEGELISYRVDSNHEWQCVMH